MNPHFTTAPASDDARALTGPKRFRQLLVRQGPVFVKVGQYLSLRPDVLPKEYCDELLELVDRVPPFTFAEASALIREDLERDPSELFTWINPLPVAAASLAQVHEAILPDGRRVGVKVQRPGIRARVERDLKRAGRVARLLQLGWASQSISPVELLKEVQRWMFDELDLRRELVNVQHLYESAHGHARMRIPEPHPLLSKGRVITTEFLTGIPFSELERHLRKGQPQRIEDLGFDRETLASNLLWSILDQIFRLEFFHADPHPGNLLALPGNVVGFVDFGLVEIVAPTLRQKQLEYLSVVYAGDIEGIYKALLDILEIGSKSDVEGFRRDFLALTRSWLRDKDSPIAPEQKTWPLSDFMLGIMRSAQRNRLQVPTEVLSMYRSLLTAETVAHRLGGQSDLRAVGADFFRSLRGSEWLKMFEPGTYQRVLLDIISLLREGPGNLHHILSGVADERLTLQVKVFEQREDQRQANARAQLLATSVVFLGLAVLIVGVGDVTLFPPLRLSHILWLLEAILAVVIAVLWRRIS